MWLFSLGCSTGFDPFKSFCSLLILSILVSRNLPKKTEKLICNSVGLGPARGLFYGPARNMPGHSGPDFFKMWKKLRTFFLGHLCSFPIQGINKINKESEFGEKKMKKNSFWAWTLALAPIFLIFSVRTRHKFVVKKVLDLLSSNFRKWSGLNLRKISKKEAYLSRNFWLFLRFFVNLSLIIF